MSTPTINHIENARQAARDLRACIAKLDQLKKDWDGGFGTWIVDSSAPGGDFENRDGLTKDDIAAIYTTVSAIDTLMAAGHDTNLLKVQ